MLINYLICIQLPVLWDISNDVNVSRLITFVKIYFILFWPRVLQLPVWLGGHHLSVLHLSGGCAGQLDGGDHCEEHQVPPHYHQLLPCLSCTSWSYNTSLFCTSRGPILSYTRYFCTKWKLNNLYLYSVVQVTCGSGEVSVALW